MEFEWHDRKRRTNLAAHGIDFDDAIAIWEGPVLEVPSTQLHHGEERFLAVGRCEGRIITVVFTWRGKVRRLISASLSELVSATWSSFTNGLSAQVSARMPPHQPVPMMPTLIRSILVSIR